MIESRGRQGHLAEAFATETLAGLPEFHHPAHRGAVLAPRRAAK